jgi:hypothetical protein
MNIAEILTTWFKAAINNFWDLRDIWAYLVSFLYYNTELVCKQKYSYFEAIVCKEYYYSKNIIPNDGDGVSDWLLFNDKSTIFHL